MAKRDAFLSSTPQDGREAWLAHHAALLGVTLEPLPAAVNTTTSTTQAISEVWGLSEVRAKKIVSFSIVLSVEFAIILLSLLARGEGTGNAATPSLNSGILHDLRQSHTDDAIINFLEKCRASLAKHGVLPQSRHLAQKQRLMKKIISGPNLSPEDLNEMLVELRNSNPSRTNNTGSAI